jgi:anti-anti-sigma regulatory factor
MQIVLSRCSGVTVIHIHGILDGHGIGNLRDCLDRLLEAGQTGAVLDFRRTRHIYFKVLPELHALAERFELRGGWLAVAGLSDYLLSIVRLQGLEDEMPVYGSPKEAVASLAAGPALGAGGRMAEVVAFPGLSR